jgi:hypothetical protein
MKLIHAGLLLAAVFCQPSNFCYAQQNSLGPTDVDGFYQPPAEAIPSVPKQRTSPKRVPKTETTQRPTSESQLTNWEEEAARQQADDDRLKPKLNICQNCIAPNDKGKPAGARR